MSVLGSVCVETPWRLFNTFTPVAHMHVSFRALLEAFAVVELSNLNYL